MSALSAYHLTLQYRSNERPWSGSHEGRNIENDEDAIRWARYFVDHIGGEYVITLYKNGTPMHFEEEPKTVGDRR